MARMSDTQRDEIVAELLTILREHPNRYFTSYYLWYRLGRDHEPLARLLEATYGDAVGEGGGAPYGPATYLSQMLGHRDDVDRQFLHADGLEVHGIPASYDEIGLFRWAPNNG